MTDWTVILIYDKWLSTRTLSVYFQDGDEWDVSQAYNSNSNIKDYVTEGRIKDPEVALLFNLGFQA